MKTCVLSEHISISLELKPQRLYSQALTEAFHSKLGCCVDVIEENSCRRRAWTSLKTHFSTNRCSYSGWTPPPWIPITLLITTMCPLFLLFISGRISFTNLTSPKKLVSITVFISPIDWHSMGPIRPIPALLTTRAYQAQTADLWRQLHCGFDEDSKNKFLWRDANDVNLLRISTLRSGRLSTQALMESSSHTSSCLISKVRPKVRPAALTRASPLLRFLMVA